MRIALIGGAGFVGHHLAQLDHEFLCVDHLQVNNLFGGSNGSLGFIDQKYRPFIWERINLIEKNLRFCDARDYHALSKALSDFKPEVIVHLAAVAHIDRADKDPRSAFYNSLEPLGNALDVARALECKFVYFSSSTVYGDFSQDVVDEDESLTPTRIYGRLKLAGEQMCRGYSETYDMPMTIVRPQALYGPRCVSRRVTQIFIEQARNQQPITIHGTGKDKHDFTYIGDLVEGMRLILGATSNPWCLDADENEELRGFKAKSRLCRTYNLTGESAVSVNVLADMVVERFGGEITRVPADPTKPARGTMSCAKIRDELGYKPRFDIEKGMNLYMDWYDEKR